MKHSDRLFLVLVTICWPPLVTAAYCLLMRNAPWWLLCATCPLVGLTAGIGMVRTVRALGLWEDE